VKIKKSGLLATAVLTAGVIVLSGCSASGDGNEAGDEAVTIRVSHVESSTSVTHEALEAVAERVEERTDGSLILEIYPDGQLGTTTDTLQQSASGETVIGYTDSASLAALGAKNLDILSGPFLFENTDQAQTFHESEMFTELGDQLVEETGVRILALNYFLGTRNVLGKDAYPNPEDMAGVKLRTPPIEAWTRTFEAVDAVPTTVEYTEAYSALQQGVVDAAESDINSLIDQKWYETVTNLTMTHHMQLFLGFAIGEAGFQKLSQEHQDALLEEFSQGGIDSTQVNADKEEETKRFLEENGVTITEADLAAYRDATASFYDGYPEGFLDDVRAAAGMN
jgi:TRAP-type C4-dicarboxylate transport system substrate-binding protein